MTMPMLSQGDVVNGRYEIISLIADTRMSVVYKAYDRQYNDLTVVLKFIKRTKIYEAQEEMESANAILMNLDSQYTARWVGDGKVYVCGNEVVDEVEGNQDEARLVPFQVIEYLEGKDLRKWIKEDIISPVGAMQAMLDILRALKALHSHDWIHRDVKPANFIRSSDGTVKVIDFGVSKRLEDASHTKVITWGYTPPEILSKTAKWSFRSDLYSAAAVFMSLLCGEEETDENGPVKDRECAESAVGKEITDLIFKNLSKNPEERHQSAEDMLVDLEGAIEKYVGSSPISSDERFIESLKVQVTDALRRWQDGLGKRRKSLPTRDEVEDVRQDVARLKEADAIEAALVNRFDNLVERVGEAYQRRIEGQLRWLKRAKGEESGWQRTVDNIRQNIAELKHFSPGPAGDHDRKLKEILRRLEGERLVTEARREAEETRADIEERERHGDVRWLVRDSKELYDHIRDHVRTARRKEVLEDLVRQLTALEEECRDYWQRMRKQREVDAVTYSQNREYEKAYQFLSDIRDEDGPTAKVEYYYLERAKDATGRVEEVVELKGPAPVEVERALEACEWDWAVFLRERVRNYLDASADALGQNNPVKADQQLNEIDSPDKGLRLDLLGDDEVNELNGLREQCKRELEEFNAFERAVQAARELAASEQSIQFTITAWQRLKELGQRYERFQQTSDEWREGKAAVYQIAVEACERNLKATRERVSQHRFDLAREYLHRVQTGLQSHADDFAQEWQEAKELRNLVTTLETKLPEIERHLRKRDLQSGSDGLDQVKGLLNQADVSRQAEYERLRNEFRALTDAEGLLGQLKREAKQANLPVARLHDIVQELRNHIQSVPAQFRDDFRELYAYASARYSLLRGRQILSMESDYEQALELLGDAAEHPQFQDQARTEIAELEERLLPANGKVREALREMKGLAQGRDFWTAYERGQRVTNEPAERKIRETLQTQIQINQEKAIAQSRRKLQQAISRGRGKPAELREHTRRLEILAPSAQVLQHPGLWSTIHRLEAEKALAANKWLEAKSRFASAAQAIPETGDDTWNTQAQDLQARAKAASKQYLLSICPKLIPSVAIEHLRRELEAVFPDDADLLLELAQALGRYAREVDEELSVKLIEGMTIDEEIENYRKALARLREAGQRAKAGVQQANQWMLADYVPDYERHRTAMLPVGPEQIARERSREAAELQTALKQESRVVVDKIYIVAHLSR